MKIKTGFSAVHKRNVNEWLMRASEELDYQLFSMPFTGPRNFPIIQTTRAAGTAKTHSNSRKISNVSSIVQHPTRTASQKSLSFVGPM